MAFEKLAKEKQNQILSAACEVFAKHGYKKASMKDIAGTAGVSKSVLFKYFFTKQNLYRIIFRLSSDSIIEADAMTRAQGEANTDMFSLMRRTAQNRLSLFKEYPWIYKFSYTSAFDPDPFVKKLVKKELENYRKAQIDRKGRTDGRDNYKGLREDISPATARQIIFWISQGYLEEKLYQNEIDPDELEQGFEKWIDILEALLNDKKRNNGPEEEKGR